VAKGVAVGHINATKRDIVVAVNSTGDDYVQVLLGNGDGTFQLSSPAHTFKIGPASDPSAASAPYGVILVDLDEDGQNDVVTSNSGTQNLSVLINSTGLGS
jgi:hypothetical protein